jgi:hypothetical protein
MRENGGKYITPVARSPNCSPKGMSRDLSLHKFAHSPKANIKTHLYHEKHEQPCHSPSRKQFEVNLYAGVQTKVLVN